jgi:putative permease
MEEMNQQITNYIRGKVLEMIVVGVATWIGFILFDLNYSLLLAVLVGFSVLIPYIGAFVVTIPVVGSPVWRRHRVLEPVCGVPDYSGAGR